MIDWPSLFLLNLFKINAALVPALVGLTCLRRLLRSQGFNRVVYGYITAFAWGMAILVVETPPSAGILHTIVILGAWLTLPLWLCIRDLTRTMPTRLKRRLALIPS